MFAAENGLKGDPRLEAISAAIRVVPNFPKKGLVPLFHFTHYSVFVFALFFLQFSEDFLFIRQGLCFRT